MLERDGFEKIIEDKGSNLGEVFADGVEQVQRILSAENSGKLYDILLHTYWASQNAESGGYETNPEGHYAVRAAYELAMGLDDAKLVSIFITGGQEYAFGGNSMANIYADELWRRIPPRKQFVGNTQVVIPEGEFAQDTGGEITVFEQLREEQRNKRNTGQIISIGMLAHVPRIEKIFAGRGIQAIVLPVESILAHFHMRVLEHELSESSLYGNEWREYTQIFDKKEALKRILMRIDKEGRVLEFLGKVLGRTKDIVNKRKK